MYYLTKIEAPIEMYLQKVNESYEWIPFQQIQKYELIEFKTRSEAMKILKKMYPKRKFVISNVQSKYLKIDICLREIVKDKIVQTRFFIKYKGENV